MCLAAAGLVVGGLGAVMQYQATRQQAEYQADVAKANALAAQYQADAAGRRGELEVDELRRQVSQTTGAGRAAYGAANVLLGSGSALSWEQDVAAAGERDVAMSRYNTAMEQWAYRNQRQDYLAQSRYSLWSGRTGAMAGLVRNSASLLGQAATTKLNFGG